MQLQNKSLSSFNNVIQTPGDEPMSDKIKPHPKQTLPIKILSIKLEIKHFSNEACWEHNLASEEALPV